MALQMNLTPGDGMNLKLQNFRGYSAYEIAVQHGFEGSESEWLASLPGKDGLEASVNGISQDETGSILLTGENIPVQSGQQETVAQALAALEPLGKALTVTEDGVDLGGRYLDNALFR